MTNFSVYFYTKIRKLRLEKDLKQSYLSKKLGISTSYYSELECGEKTPSLELIFRIINFYNIDFNSLFGYESTNNKEGEGNLKLLELYEKLINSQSNEINSLRSKK